MSWYFEMVGKPADVKAKIQKDINVPQQLKDTVAAFADEIGNPKSGEVAAGAIRVKSAGHFGGSWSSLTELVIAPVQLVEPAPTS